MTMRLFTRRIQKWITASCVIFLGCQSLSAQVCDPGTAPTGLTSTYTPFSGALLEWDVVPGSIGVQIKATTPSGSNITRRIIGFERDQYLVPDALLTTGIYTWQVQAACSTIPPYAVTPISASNTFEKGGAGGGGTCPVSATDVDGNVYTVVEIGDQCWMGQNLKVERYRDGTNIPTGLSNSAWNATTNGAFSVYNNIAANKATFGLLYNWYAVDDSRGLCPTGWRVPSDAEWTQLTDFLGGASVAGGKMKTTGTLSAGTGLWESPNGAATNSSGFSGLPGGGRNSSSGYFNQGFFGFWWSRSDPFPPFAVNRNLQYVGGLAGQNEESKQDGFSVRCLEGEPCPSTVTDVDGNVYNVVGIGGQCWMAENLKVEHYRDGSNIPTGLSNSAWAATTSGAIAVYDDVAANKDTYGLLYNWFTTTDTRGLCPTGWHVPTDAEWTAMITVLDPSTCGSCTGFSHSLTAGGQMKTTGTLSAGTGLWQAPNTSATNSSGFSGLPGGYRSYAGPFNTQGFDGYWWSSSESSTSDAWGRGLYYINGTAFRSIVNKLDGFSVRCLRD